ncbi:unnamed protein product [Nyctereutes procyonoides]|uniref:(raccoon dog) hypothetical protein n=1 Tax=Nyctereutes procyonoides TaxID=34880 RepID=A0A811YG72_NYCPR|nr:unnamed protein product [Nyctereutes procyonoides]
MRNYGRSREPLLRWAGSRSAGARGPPRVPEGPRGSRARETAGGAERWGARAGGGPAGAAQPGAGRGRGRPKGGACGLARGLGSHLPTGKSDPASSGRRRGSARSGAASGPRGGLAAGGGWAREVLEVILDISPILVHCFQK